MSWDWGWDSSQHRAISYNGLGIGQTITHCFLLPSSLFPLPSSSYSFLSDLLLQNSTSMPREPETERTMPQSCFLCKEQSLETSGDLHQCLLCNRAYCDAHKGRFQGTCETNHQTYAHDHPDQPNVFPSLGERERTLMTLQSPSSGSPGHQIA
jgi:hypothetical protein